MAAARAADPPPHTVVLEGAAVRTVTVTMLDTFRGLGEELGTEGSRLVLAGFPAATLERLRRSGWFSDFEERGGVQPTVDAAVGAAREHG